MTMRQRKRRRMSRAHEALFPRSERCRPFYYWNGLALIREDDYLGLRAGRQTATYSISLPVAIESWSPR